MNNLPQSTHGVNLNLSSTRQTYGSAKRYLVPGTEFDERPKTACIGDLSANPPEVCSVRSRAGKRWGDNELAFNEQVKQRAEADGFRILRISIHYKTKDITVNYRTDFETLQQYGERVLGVSGWELSMPLCYWSIDGADPVGPAVVAEPVPTVEQPVLFDFAEPVKRYGGAY